MAVQPVSTAVYLPRLVAELPADWAASEGAGFLAPSGTVVRVRVDGARGATADQVLDAHLSSLADDVGDVEVFDIATRRILAGSDAQQREYSYRRDGEEKTGAIIATVIDDHTVVVTSDWPTDGPSDGQVDGLGAIQTVLDGLRLIDRAGAPTAEGGDPGQKLDAAAAPTSGHPQPGRGADPHMWDVPRAGWTNRDLVADPVTSETSWSREEVAVLAAHMGASSFPTIGVDALGALTAEARAATLTAVVGSLLARDLAEIRNGTVEPATSVAALLRIAVEAGLTVYVDRSTRTTSASCCYAVGGDQAVRIEIPNAMVRRTARFPSEQLVARIIEDWLPEDGAIRSQVDPTADAITGRTISLDDMARDRAGIASFTRVRVGWWEGDIGIGGHCGWAVSDAGELLLAELDGSVGAERWRLSATDSESVRGHLLDHLPTAAPLTAGT